MTEISCTKITAGYRSHHVFTDLCLKISPGEFVALVGPNGSGKSTLLRNLGRIMRPRTGVVKLSGQDISRIPTKKVAQVLGFMPQAPGSPEGLTIAELVRSGRHPHQRWSQTWSAADTAAVDRALDLTDLSDLQDSCISDVSGGQRQRAWIALALAQETAIMLLDEPTTYLDLAHAIEVLEVLTQVNQKLGRTIVMVIHDLNLAARYAGRVIALKDGHIKADGPPDTVFTSAHLENIFGLAAQVLKDPNSGVPIILPTRRPR